MLCIALRAFSVGETADMPLSSCAVVVAPVIIEGQNLGAVGLLGPTRMDYPRAMAAAHVVGERLGEKLGGPDARH